MKQKLLNFFTVLTLIAGIASCNPQNQPSDPKNNTNPDDSTTVVPGKDDTAKVDTPSVVVKSFPRKQMIEHFTGQDCGYCPYGMDIISEAIRGREDQFVWLSNHAGFSDDSFTINESKRIASKFGVNFAPAMMLNRTKFAYTDSDGNHNDMVFHPYVLTSIVPSKLSTTAPLSVNITPEQSGSQLNIKVDGETGDITQPLLLIVAIKESGLHGVQSDYNATWNGWEDFVHSNVVRKYVSNYLGDTLTIENNAYQREYQIEWNSSWNVENSSVVAYVIGNDGEVLNANQAPVVAGTNGGNDIEHAGIKAVEVPDTYPEYDDVPEEYRDLKFISATYSYVGKFDNGNKAMRIILMSNTKIRMDGVQCQPYAEIYLVLGPNDVTTQLPTGTFEFSNEIAPNTIWAGEKVEEEFYVGGSMLYFAQTSYLTNGYVVGPQWLLMAGGTLTITDDSITFETTNLHGTTIKGNCVGKILRSNMPSAKMPAQRKLAN